MATSKDYGLGEFAYPRGWFVIAPSDQVTRQPQGIRFFGQELALYRGESGRAVLLDAFCPHMKANIAKNATSYVVHDGNVEGDSIRCPFHAWRFGPDGRCNEIPYHDGPIPEAAKIRAWRIEERYGMLLAWHDPEGGEPDYALPDLPEWDDPSWMHWAPESLGAIAIHPVELLDNMADIAHFGPVHGLGRSYEEGVAYYENTIAGINLRQRQGGTHRAAPGDGILQESDGIYTGPALLFTRIRFEQQHIIMLTAHTPVDEGVSEVVFGLMVQASSNEPSDADRQLAAFMLESMRAAFKQDFEIWLHKAPCPRPMQVRSDGPFDKVRDWYRQFYNPRAETSAYHQRLDGTYTVHNVPGVPINVAA